MEAVLLRAPESTDFRLKSIKKMRKSRKKSVSFCLGPRCRRFESCHSDQKRKEGDKLLLFVFRLNFIDSNLSNALRSNGLRKEYFVKNQTIDTSLNHVVPTMSSLPIFICSFPPKHHKKVLTNIKNKRIIIKNQRR